LIIDKCSNLDKFVIKSEIQIELSKKKSKVYETRYLPFLTNLINNPSIKRELRDIGGLFKKIKIIYLHNFKRINIPNYYQKLIIL